MSFWSGNSAAPSFFATLPFQTLRPQYLRTDMPPLRPESYTLQDGKRATIRRLFGTQSGLVADFLAAHYGGDDWRLPRAEAWIGNYLRDSEVVALGLFTAEGALIATIFSVPVGEAVMSHGGALRDLRVIEGLCVAPAYRGAGVAGFMIAHADAFTSYKFGVCAHLWSREVAAASFWDTALRSDLYGYTLTGFRSGDPIEKMDWSVFVRLWTESSPSWISNAPCIIGKTPQNRRNASSVYYGYGALAVVNNTGRVGADGAPIYEIVWSGKYADGILEPATADLDYKQLLNGIAAALPAGGVLFGTTSMDAGGLRNWDHWTLGNSGSHAVYIYNYMPPAFGTCRIFCVRDEL